MNEFFEAWYFIALHPMNNGYKGWEMSMYDLDIHIAKVDPETRIVTDDPERNTHIEVWLEFGPYEYMDSKDDPELYKDVKEYDRWRRTHDPRLDCGGDTFEEAIIKLAHLVKEHYGDYNAET